MRRALATNAADRGVLLALDEIKDFAIFRIDLDGRIASWNEGAEQLKGYAEPEAVGKPFAMLFTPEDAAAGRPEHEMRQALEHDVYRGEGLRRRKDGSVFDAQVTLRLIRDGGGRPEAFVKVTQDITERKIAERMRVREAELQRQLIGMIGHDLRSPLAAIVMSAGLLLRRGKLDPRQERVIARIISSAERGLRLAHEVLDFTQAQLAGRMPIQRQALDLFGFLPLVVEEVRLSDPDHQVTLELSGDGTMEGDPDRLAQLITNLLANALAHGSLDDPVRVSADGAGAAIVLKIHNRGPAIAAEALPRLFEPMSQFQTQRSRREGSVGLGLFIADQIVRAHDGSLTVSSTEQEGTTFTIELPRRASPPAADRGSTSSSVSSG